MNNKLDAILSKREVSHGVRFITLEEFNKYRNYSIEEYREYHDCICTDAYTLSTI